MIATIVSWFTGLLSAIAKFFEWFGGMLADVFEFFLDLPLVILKGILDGVLYLLESIPVPSFLDGGGALQSVFSALPNDVQYFVGFFGIQYALAIIGAGVIFRLTRKALTLGQW